MSRPDRDELVAALLAATPKGYRERKPQLALERATALAAKALASWPAQPVRQRVLGAGMALYDRGDLDEAPLGIVDHLLDIEAAGVVLHLSLAEGRLRLRFDPLGTSHMHRLDVRAMGFHEVQGHLDVAGKGID